MVFLEAPEGFTVLFEPLEHPIPAKVHFHLDGFQQCRGGIFLEVPFEVGGCSSVLCAKHEVEMAAHQAPAIKMEAMGVDKMVKRIGDHLFVGGSDKQIDLIYYIECQEITRVKGNARFFIRKHTLTCLKYIYKFAPGG